MARSELMSGAGLEQIGSDIAYCIEDIWEG